MTEAEQLHSGNGQPVDSAEDVIRVQQERIGELEQELQSEPATLEEILERFQPDPDYEPVYKIRELKGRDGKKIISMIRSVRDDERINAAFRGEATGSAASQILDVLLEKLEEEVTPFLADVAQIEDPDEAEMFWEFDVGNDLINDEAFLKRLRSATRFVMAGKKLFGR